MEAAAAGTPLILGEMSSEHEHFGADAQYVHPADVERIASAVARLLVSPDDAAQRAARAARFSAAFSITRHADETWALYERLQAAPSARPALVADVSALLHFTRVGQPFTGVPWVERSILRELAALDPNLRTIVFNDVKGRFIEIGMGDLTNFDEQRFNTRHWFSSDDDAGADRRATLRFADASVPVLPHGTPSVNTSAPAFRSRAIAIGKRAMQRAPRPLREPAIALLRRVRPGFDPFRMPLDLATTGADVAVASPAQPAEPSDEGRIRFEHALAKVTVHDVPRHRQVASGGARLLTLGQSWLSNGPLLAAMIRLVETRALSLEPYVYDLTYHTGAHQTGWSDNDERFSRLLQLLRYSRIVFTESRQVEGELQKLRVSRGLTYRTRRTGLRGRDLLDVEPSRAAPRYAPDTFVLYVSSFNKRKHHDFLIHVWSNLYETWIAPTGRSFRLVLAGEVQDEHKFADPEFVARLARSNIDVHASVSDSVLARWMRDCALTAYPSLQEGWGLPAQESLMCGKVCLVSNSLPVAQEIANPAFVRIPPGDFYGWHEALKSWLENEPMRRAFAERAREYRAPTWREIADVIHSCE